MKDILFIGGPESVTGVDRIGDDLLSILKAEHLYDRKTVVVWPTDSFLAPPSDTSLLEIHLDMNSVKNDQMSRQNLLARVKNLTVEVIEKIKEQALSDPGDPVIRSKAVDPHTGALDL